MEKEMGSSPRPLDTELIHRLTLKIADCVQNEIEKSNGAIGFLEMKIAIVQALECLYKYQNQVTVIKMEQEDGGGPKRDEDRGPPMVA